MIKIWCDGNYLDLPQNIKLSLTRKNNAFGFGSLELSRSVSFSVPCTPNNNKIFNLANNEHRSGLSARRKLKVQIQYSGGIIDGLLYINTSKKDSYDCVFVFGELLPLQALSEAGNIAEAETFTDETKITPRYNANSTHANDIWASIKYKNNNDNGFPSVRLAGLFRNVESRFGVRVNFSEEMQKVRVIPEGVETPSISTYFKKMGEYYGIYDLTASGIIEAYNLDTPEHYKRAIINGQEVIQGDNDKNSYIAQDFAIADGIDSITLQFPNTFPPNVFIARYRSHEDVTFYGDYSFSISAGHAYAPNTIVGLPLANREITINRLDSNGELNYFSFYDINRWYNDEIGGNYQSGFIGWDDCRPVGDMSDIYFSYYLTIDTKTDSDVSELVNYKLQDNIPDVSFIDVINIFSIIFGKRVVYNNGVLDFAEYNVNDWDIVELKNIIKVEKIDRKFSDWQRANEILFNSSKWVFNNMRERVTYYIDNDTLKAQKEVYKVPFSEGNEAHEGETKVAEVWDLVTYRESGGNLRTENQGDKPTITIAGDAENLARIHLASVPVFEQICDKSTQIEINALMPLHEYMRIKENDKVLLNGAMYVWNSSTWSENKAKFVLSQL